MTLSKAKEWLERVIVSDHLEPRDLTTLVSECARERLHLDYKSGLEFTKDAPDRTLRKYAAAFGNSDGGLLIFGYHQKTGFDGVPPFGKASPHDWATRTLSDLTAYFSPPPRIVEVDVDGKIVLVVAVPRSPRLIPLHERGALVYYMRIGDSVAKVPPWLVSDLLLGRRNYPVLEARVREAEFREGEELTLNIHSMTLVLRLDIENLGFLNAEGLRIGIIAWIAPKRGRYGSPTQSLLQHVEQRAPDHYEAQVPQPPWQLAHEWDRNAATTELLSFDKVTRTLAIPLPLFPEREWTWPMDPPLSAREVSFLEAQKRNHTIRRGWVRHLSALYVVSRNAEPRFYQVHLSYTGGGTIKRFEIGPPSGLRPRVAVEFLPIDEDA